MDEYPDAAKHYMQRLHRTCSVYTRRRNGDQRGIVFSAAGTGLGFLAAGMECAGYAECYREGVFADSVDNDPECRRYKAFAVPVSAARDGTAGCGVGRGSGEPAAGEEKSHVCTRTVHGTSAFVPRHCRLI